MESKGMQVPLVGLRAVKYQVVGLLGGALAGLSVLFAPSLMTDSQLLFGWIMALGVVFTLGLVIAISTAFSPPGDEARIALARANALHVATEGLLWASFVFVWSSLPTAAERLSVLALLGTATAIHLLYRDHTPRAALLLVLGALGPSILWCGLYGTAPERLVAWSLCIALGAGIAWLFGPVRARVALTAAAEEAKFKLKKRVAALEQELADAQRATRDASAEREMLSRNLETSKAEAARALTAQSAFLANMSHEIRTPMNGILGLSELLAKTPLSQKQQRFLAGITSSGEGLLSLINNVLDLAKAESGKLELESRPFDLADLLDDVVASFAAAMHRKGVALVTFCDVPAPCHYLGDAERLRQVLTNLIGNAMKFTDRGEVQVRVANRSNGRIGFEVVDSGIGIAPEAIGRIFDSFTQADTSTTRNFGGTGLGLTICRELVHLMGGRIAVESQLGKGSRFWFELPLQPAPAGALARSAWNPAILHGQPVLLLADPGSVRDAAAYALRRWGMVLEVFPEPEGVRDRLVRWADHSRRPTLIVDERVAGLPAAVVLRELRSATQGLNVPIVILIGFGNLDETSQWLQPGVQTFVTKPVRQSDLLGALVKGLDVTNAGAQAPAVEVPTGIRPGARILVVEDNPVNLELAVSMLENLGCTCETAEDGEAAVARLCQREPGLDLVLLDCQMPKLDGYGVARQLRDYERQQRVARPLAVVALTANALAGDRELCLSAGMDDYLSKPFTQNQLLEALQRWLPPVSASSAKPAGPDWSSTASSSEPWVGDLAGDNSLDATVLKEIFALESGGRPGLFDRLVSVFRSSATERLAEMRRAISDQDAAALNRSAHALKSGAAQLGALALATSCRSLEEAAHNGELQSAASLFELCELEFRAASSLLTRVAQMRQQAA